MSGTARSNLAVGQSALFAIASLALSACSVHPFCFNCREQAVAIDAGSFNNSFDAQIAENGPDAGAPPDAGTPEVCQGADLDRDLRNCGSCGHECPSVSGATVSCASGNCSYVCAPNYHDLDSDLSQPKGNGCEYYCVPSAAVATQCTGIDVTCQGPNHANDGCDFQSDPLNCGGFAKACLLGNAISKCVHGQCQPLCNQGFGPDVAKPLPNCDCVLVNGGKDTCGHDNDCDGKIAPDLSADPENCGSCGHSCEGAFVNSEPLCMNGQCVPGRCFDGYVNNTGHSEDGCNYNCSSQCRFPFATGVCQSDDSCVFGHCLEGHYDIGNTQLGCQYACTPSGAEICDGKDNDCDGQIDQGFDLAHDVNNCGTCGCACSAFFPNANVLCNATTNACDISNCALDSCPTGWHQVVSGSCYKCPVFPTKAETCNGLDDDCDGIVDDNLTDSGASCVSSGQGVCAAGKILCKPASGQDLSTDANVCVSNTQPSVETCNGLDDDCDGAVDNAPSGGFLPGTGSACGVSQVGTCRFGTKACVNGLSQDVTKPGNAPDSSDKIVCLGEIDPLPELCNGTDDDCNGIVDDNLQDSALGLVCGSMVGACRVGMTTCVAATSGDSTTDQVACVGSVSPTQEICDGSAPNNGTDENCDGSIDEGCVFAQSVPARLDRTDGTNTPAQGAVESFQLSTAHLDDAFLISYSNKRSGSPAIFARSSTDGGASWGSADVAVTASTCVEPSAFMRQAAGFISYSQFNGGVRRIFVARSTGGGFTTWGTGVQLWNPGSTGIDCFSSHGVVAKADVATNKDWLAVVWSEIGGAAATPTRDVRFSFSLDGGATWRATPLQVNSGAGAGLGEQPVIATNGSGKVYVAWRDKRTSGLAQAYVSSIDLSATTPAFSAAQVLQPNLAHASAEQITIAAEGTNVYVAWVDLRAAAKTIRVAASNDSGATFTQQAGHTDGIVIDPDGVLSDASSPSLAAASGKLIASWEDRRSGQPNIRFNRSDNGGQSWMTTTPRVDTGTGLGSVAAYTPSIGFGQGSTIFVTWRDLRSPLAAILANESLDGGRTWRPDAGVLRMDLDTGSPAAGASADSQTPYVLPATGSNRMSVVWIDFRNAAGASGVNGNIWVRGLN